MTRSGFAPRELSSLYATQFVFNPMEAVVKHRVSKFVVYSLVLAGVLCVAQTSFADTLQGSVFENAATFVPGGPNPPFTIPSGTPNITFTLSNSSTPFLFSFYSTTDSNLTGFLTNNGTNGNSVTYNTGSNQVSPVSCPTGTLNPCGINNDIMGFTGMATMTNGYTYSFTHDDGMYLNFGSDQVITAGVPTSAAANTFTWTGASGLQSFSLFYDEVNGAPAQLSAPGFGVTPEPSSLLLLGSGLAGLAFLLFRKRDKPAENFAGNVSLV